MSNMLDASHQPNPRPDEYQPDWIPPSSRDPNGTHSLNDRGASPTDAKKLSFKQILEIAMNNVSDQLLALLEEELDKMEDDSEEIEQQSTTTHRDSRL
ncbi:hypothetical protein SMACR_12797 [Sordaria macrospora]|uniref:WGS project CABT00000000 data, contig 2.59 n=2 Tax=Sordaria macrospora TaxID=5147 RepID=F7WA96_SORMK|nr:uncharacterized protein SMAC_12797 [Sordaria macrospora k-hell]KAA8635586.1 hypothetical protein SMACR_12797 [Sordaria macrospora]KAH7629445.1 hypothetical protein B0T09DRAFT_156466 [Sordaria sp. MPI-SDFR-AT-0083]WPJ66331.1 hypothetical protein SMAC4_12797 [Sordaria macrospora]CCC05290.1 unnamed protein product [Sordaria macrospora k-hell]